MAHRLDRAQALAYRACAQDLHRPRVTATHHHGRAARPFGLALALAMSGSPHLHRHADLPMSRAALRPRDNKTLRAYHGDR